MYIKVNKFFHKNIVETKAIIHSELNTNHIKLVYKYNMYHCKNKLPNKGDKEQYSIKKVTNLNIFGISKQ